MRLVNKAAGDARANLVRVTVNATKMSITAAPLRVDASFTSAVNVSKIPNATPVTAPMGSVFLSKSSVRVRRRRVVEGGDPNWTRNAPVLESVVVFAAALT